MDKAGKEGKPWISGLCDYRVTPQLGSIASPWQLMTQRTPREESTSIAQCTWCTRNALDPPGTHQRQGNNSKPERKYQELLPGRPVWVQHKQNTT